MEIPVSMVIPQEDLDQDDKRHSDDNSLHEGERREDVDNLKESSTYRPLPDLTPTLITSERIKYKFLYLSTAVSIISSALFAFLLGENLEALLPDLKMRQLVFVYIPFTCFVAASMTALLLLKKVITHVNLNLKKYEIMAFAGIGIFVTFASAYMGSIRNYQEVLISFVARFVAVGLLIVIGRLTRSLRIRLPITIALGFVEAYIVVWFEFHLQCFILGALLSFANVLLYRLEAKYKILEIYEIPRRTFAYVTFTAICVVNGVIIHFFSVLTIYLNSKLGTLNE